MMTIERAGIDLSQRRIWADRQRVCKLVPITDAVLTAWCQRILGDRQPSPSGGLEVIVPSDDRSYAKSDEFQIVFWIYRAQTAPGGKPDVNVDYSFYRSLPDGGRFFNRTAPQQFNAATLPAAFSAPELVAGVGVPLTSFPAGGYRLEIKVTDKVSSQIVTRSVSFTVLPE
jgi:hypothetical protein